MAEQADDFLCLPRWSGGAETVQVWLADLDKVVSEQHALEDWLSQDEQERARKCCWPTGRHRFIAARYILRNLLGYYLCCGPQEVQFSYGAHGKPEVIPRQKKYALSFNLSHSGHLALFAFSWGRQLGIDISS